MTKEELEKEMVELEKQHYANQRKLYQKYALANNPYKEGDIITDHVASIQIQSIGLHVSMGEPCCKYIGLQLNKDGKPSKKQDHNIIYQTNILTK